MFHIYLVGGGPTPLKNNEVNWDDYFQYIGKIEMFHLGFETSETLQLLEPWALEPWNLGTLKPWTSGTLGPWGHGTLEAWNLGTLEPWTLELGTWNPGDVLNFILGFQDNPNNRMLFPSMTFAGQ